MKILESYNGKELPKLKTEHLILRQRTVVDVPAMFEYVSLPEVCHPAAIPLIKTLDDEYDYFENRYYQNLAKNELPSGYGITLKGEDKVIGSCDFNHRHADDVFEIGYLLHPDYWGQGYMTEAVAALVEVAFSILKLHKVEIRCYDYNKGSRRVAEKLGFTLEGRIRDRNDGQGKRCDELVFGLLRREWEVTEIEIPEEDKGIKNGKKRS